MKTISIVNQKGGVGKTTTAMNIGAALNRLGRKVLLIDLDPQGNLSTYLGWNPVQQSLTANDLIYFAASGRPLPDSFAQTSAEGIEYIPANRLLASAVSILGTDPDSQGVLARLLKEPPFQHYDYILIDCKPSLDLLVTNALAASDSVLVPVQAELFALTAVSEVMETIRRTKAYNPKLEVEGFLLTMYRAQTTMSKEVRQALEQNFGEAVFPTPISFSAEAGKSTARQESISASLKLGQEYMEAARHIERRSC